MVELVALVVVVDGKVEVEQEPQDKETMGEMGLLEHNSLVLEVVVEVLVLLERMLELTVTVMVVTEYNHQFQEQLPITEEEEVEQQMALQEQGD